MKPKNVGADFFDEANDQAIADAGLMGEQLDAIELLRDLKEKTKIFERCYKNKTQRRKPVLQKKAEPAPAQEQAPAPAEQAPAQEEQAQEQAPAEQAQVGGRRRHRKSKKQHGGHKRSGHRRSKKHGHKRSKKNYKGGADNTPMIYIPKFTRDPPRFQM